MVLVLVVLAAIAVALLPTILSSAGLRNSLIAEANRRIGGTIELQGLETGWTEKSITGLRLWPGEVDQGEPLLALPSAVVRVDWWPLLFGKLAVAGRIEGFDAHFVVHEDGSTNLEDFLGETLGGGAGGGGQGEGARGAPPRIELPPIWCDLSLVDGSALFVDEAAGLTTGVENLQILVRSAKYDDPIALTLSADLRVQDSRSPFALTAGAFGADDPGWTVTVQAQRLQPGTLTAPLLAAAFPLLAGDGEGGAVTIEAPLDLDLALRGGSLQDALAGKLDGVKGEGAIALGAGAISGGLWGRLREAVAALRAGGAAGADLDLDFHGFSAVVALEGGRLSLTRASLLDAEGGERLLPISGHATLDGTLHYTIPWSALLRGERAAQLVGARALAIEGPWTAPTLSLGLDGLLSDALAGELERRVDEAAGEAQKKLDEQLEKKLGGLLDKLGGKP